MTEFEEDIEKFIKNYGFEELPKNKKELLKALKAIIYKEKVEIDYTDMKHSNDSNYLTSEAYVERIHDLQVNVLRAEHYAYNVKGMIKKEKKEKIKKIFRK